MAELNPVALGLRGYASHMPLVGRESDMAAYRDGFRNIADTFQWAQRWLILMSQDSQEQYIHMLITGLSNYWTNEHEPSIKLPAVIWMDDDDPVRVWLDPASVEVARCQYGEICKCGDWLLGVFPTSKAAEAALNEALRRASSETQSL